MLKRFLILFGLVMVMASAAFAAAPVKQQMGVSSKMTACELRAPASMTFTRGIENCSLSQVKQMYLLFSDAIQDVGEEDEFSVEIPYDVGICADGRWVWAKTATGTIYCYNACECTDQGDVCHAECVYI